MNTPENLAILGAWHVADQKLATAKAEEMELRKQVAELFFKNPEEGTNTHELADGFKLKLNFKLNYRLDKDNAKVEAALETLDKMGNEGTFIAERIVGWKPELSVAEYRKLENKYKTVINGVLTISPGSPSLEIVAPKGK